MCGIIGYIGEKKSILEIIEDLKIMEYRGYDSAGIAGCCNYKEFCYKSIGVIDNLKKEIKSEQFATIAIGHTRWATHGKVSLENCHPHFSKNKKWAIVHNGIIENYEELKKINNLVPLNETDSVVVSELLERKNTETIYDFIDLFKNVEGSYAIIAKKKNEECLYIAKNKSPLYLTKINGGFLIASDILCFVNKSIEYYTLENNEFAQITHKGVEFFDNNKKIILKKISKLNLNYNITKNSDSHFMKKEIFEQGKIILDLVKRYEENHILEILCKNKFEKFNKVLFIGCGTAYHAGLMGARFIEEIAGIESRAEMASEFIYKLPKYINKNTLVVAISQSGETADTLQALELAKKLKAKTIALTNVEYSTITKIADYVLPTCAGPEIAVASTKAYVCQLCVIYAFACHLWNERNKLTIRYFDNLRSIIPNIFDFNEILLDKIADKIIKESNCIFIGKNLDYITACESSLKLKEVSYINSSSYAAGELKHGYIALIEEKTPVVVFSTDVKMIDKLRSAANEAKTRGADIIFVTNQKINCETQIIEIKSKNKYLSQILEIIPMQLLAYNVSIKKGLNPDKPRNLAKSVTVE